MGGLFILLSELVEGTHLAGTALHLFTSLALGGLSRSWQDGQVHLQLGTSCPRCLPLGRLLLCSSAGRAPISPWCAPVALGLCGAALLPAGSDLAAAVRGCGCSAAGRLLLGVVHCRREQGRRSQAGDEQGRGLQWMGAGVCPLWGESLFSPAF